MPILVMFKANLIFPFKKWLGTKTPKGLKEQDHSMEVSMSLYGESGSVIRMIVDRISESTHSLTLKLYIC